MAALADPEVMDARWHCHDCKGGNHDYMVKKEVWLQAWPTYHEEHKALLAEIRQARKEGRTNGRGHLLLCFNCLKKRLGRPLTVDDFDLDIIINDGIKLGVKLGLQAAGKT